MGKNKKSSISSIQDQLEWLFSKTTVKWIECHQHEGVVCGEKLNVDRFLHDQGNPVSFTDRLETHWQSKFNQFGTDWSEERQKYRLLYDTMRSFFASFVGLRINKVASTESSGKNNKEVILYGDLATSHLMQMYMSGKKVVDLFKSLDIEFDNVLGGKFSETRNKLFEHNHNPNCINDIVLEPDFWSVIATKSLLPIYIHTKTEREYEAFIDYYQDYYDMEKMFVSIVEGFSVSEDRNKNKI